MDRRRSFSRIAIVTMLVTASMWISGYTLFARENTDKQTTRPASTDSTQRTGEQIFMENCSRCHKPPLTISPGTTGTIVMHMRVRAKLSRQDEQTLLRYLAP